LSALIAGVKSESDGGSANVNRSTGNAVVVAGPQEFPGQDPEGTVNSRTIYRISGIAWADQTQAVPVRRISAGRQIAWPVGRHGLCVQDSAFWAVNIGSLAAATHPLTGHASGVAAVLGVKSDGNLEILTDRLNFVRRDGSSTIADGTLIQLAYVSGTLTIVWADCAPREALTGLEASP
jgi:hypothetical protein